MVLFKSRNTSQLYWLLITTTFSFRIIANGPLNTSIKDRCVVYVEISKRENVIAERIPLKMDFPEYSIPVKRMSGMNLDEVGSEKVRAILTRKKGRDIFDLYFLIDSKKILFNPDLINRKLEFYRMEFSTFLFMNEVKSRAQRFEKDLKNLVFNKLPDYESIMEKIERWIQVQNTPWKTITRLLQNFFASERNAVVVFLPFIIKYQYEIAVSSFSH